jgi:phage-related protein
MIAADMRKMADGNFSAVHTKKLAGPVRELIVGHHRIPYFLVSSVIYFVSGFQKKTAKTPKAEIAYAQKAYQAFKK